MPLQHYCVYVVSRGSTVFSRTVFSLEVSTLTMVVLSVYFYFTFLSFFSVCFYRILVMMRFINQFLLAFCLGGAILYTHHLQILNIIFIKIFFTHIRTFRSVPIFRSGSFKAHFPQVQMHFVLGFFQQSSVITFSPSQWLNH